MKQYTLNFPLLFIVAIAIGCLAFFGFSRLDIDTDIAKLLPTHEQVITDALEIFQNHPIHDQVAVDISIDKDAKDILAGSGDFLEQKMRASGLFTEVGMGDFGTLIAELAQQVAHQLPVMFSQQELERNLAPRLQPGAIEQRLKEAVDKMAGLEGIGQAAFLGADPLGFKDIVLAQLIHLAPSSQVTIYKGHPLSADGRHLLVVGRPVAPGSNTAMAKQLTDFFANVSQQLTDKYAPSGVQVRLLPAGAFKAALDNEEMIKHDVRLALGLSTAGIVLLLLLSFPRPLLSLLSLIPPLAGTAMALFVYSLFNSSISIMVLGFSGALISIMDDYSITYLLFLDRPHTTKGEVVAHEVQSIGGILALLTTIGSFLVLCFSDFPVFRQLGEFTALGLIFTYLFMYCVYPRIFPVMPPSRTHDLPIYRLVTWVFNLGRPGLIIATLLAFGLLFFAKPEFHISLSDMNTVSKTTLAEEKIFTSVWGDMGQKIYLMTTASTIKDLQEHNDRLLEKIEKDTQADRLQSVFVPSMIFPGQQRSEHNFNAWRHFWTPERVHTVQAELVRIGSGLGFKADAFAGFFSQIEAPHLVAQPQLSERYNKLFGITSNANGELIQFTAITPGKQYQAPAFFKEYGDHNKIFDSNYFSKKLGDHLFSSFMVSLAGITAIVTLLLFLYFLNFQLTVFTLLPLVFAYICTLGTLKLIGHPLDIPGLMLSVVILGVGVDYTVFIVCGCQWYGSMRHPGHLLVRSAVLLSAASTCIGFGVLCFAQHSTLRSIGILSLCGLGYALLGTCLILPPLLQRYFANNQSIPQDNTTLIERVRLRYRFLEAYPRMFARYKLQFDPLFGELPKWLHDCRAMQTIIDIGCGYGVPACWCLEQYPEVRVIGLDPDPQRVRVAARAVGDRGSIHLGAAPDLPNLTGPADVVLLLDMCHYLDDDQLATTFARCWQLLAPGGALLLRFVTRPQGSLSTAWYLENWRVRLRGHHAYYRQPEELRQVLLQAGFVDLQQHPAINRELFWFKGHKPATTVA